MTSSISQFSGQSIKTISPSVAISRLTALWALNEAGLGGFLHIFKTPFSGLIMASIAIILITLIAYFANRKHTLILKSLFLVLIAKIIISPQAGFPAYLAVLFQGFLGALIFKYIKSFRLGAILLGSIALFETALQKVLLILLMFGSSLWESFDSFVFQISRAIGVDVSNGSVWLVCAYFSIYLVGGFLAGNFSYVLIKSIKSSLFEDYRETKIDDNFIMIQQYYLSNFKINKTKKGIFTYDLMLILIFAVVAFFLPTQNGWRYGVYSIIRAVFFVSFWFFVINPFLVKTLKKYFSIRQKKYQEEINDVFDFMNTLRKLVIIAWKETSQLQGLGRFSTFMSKSLAYTLLYEK